MTPRRAARKPPRPQSQVQIEKVWGCLSEASTRGEQHQTTLRHSGGADSASQGRAKSRWPLPWFWSRTRVIQLKGDGPTPASTRRFEVSPTRKSTYRKPEKDLCMCQYLHWHHGHGFFWKAETTIKDLHLCKFASHSVTCHVASRLRQTLHASFAPAGRTGCLTASPRAGQGGSHLQHF